MKIILSLLSMCILGCGVADPGIDPNSIVLDRRYDLSSCSPSDCIAPFGRDNGHIDSVRLVLKPDRTADWMFAISGNTNPCYIELKDCTTPYIHVFQQTGTYSFLGDSLIVQPVEGFRSSRAVFKGGDIPIRVLRSWRGPDSLTMLDIWAFSGVLGPYITLRNP